MRLERGPGEWKHRAPCNQGPFHVNTSPRQAIISSCLCPAPGSDPATEALERRRQVFSRSLSFPGTLLEDRIPRFVSSGKGAW